MDTKLHQQPKKVRIRTNPVKKWNSYEEKLLIEYLLQNRDGIEHPTARLFYDRFCEEKKLNIEWKLVRSKVRNMRMSYYKTRSALEATNDEVEENNIIRKCNFYNELDMIFAHRYMEASLTFNMSSEDFKFQLDVDETSTAASERSDIDVTPTSSTNRNGIFKKSPTHQTELIHIESGCSVEESLLPEMENEDRDIKYRKPVKKEKGPNSEKRRSNLDILPTSSTNRKDICQSVPPYQPHLMQIGSAYSVDEGFMPKMQNEDLDIKERELDIKEKELELEEKRLQLKEKKMISEENIKMHKINSREKLKMIEMEMKERLALEELKLKYK